MSASSIITRRDKAALAVGRAKISRQLTAFNKELANIKSIIRRLVRDRKFQEIAEQEQKLKRIGARVVVFKRLLETLDDQASTLDLSPMMAVLDKMNRQSDSSGGDEVIMRYIQQATSQSSDYEVDNLPMKLTDCMSEVEFQEYEAERRRLAVPPSRSLIDF